MNVDYYRSHKEIKPHGKTKDVIHYLSEIRNGKHKSLIEAIRTEQNETIRKELKSQLGAVTYCGTFNGRAKANLVQHSGFSILDFDKLENVDNLKDYLKRIVIFSLVG